MEESTHTKSTLFDEIIGKTKAEAVIIIKAAGFTCRVTKEDGDHYMGTCDFNPNRLDLEIQDGLVVEPTLKKVMREKDESAR